jgi:hypothetical protein
MWVVRAMSKSGRGNPPKEFQFKKGVSGNPEGRPPQGRSKGRKSQLVSDIISEVKNAPTAYREGGRTKRASRPELALKKLVNSAIEGDVRSADELLKLRAKAGNSKGAKSQKIYRGGLDTRFRRADRGAEDSRTRARNQNRSS